MSLTKAFIKAIDPPNSQVEFQYNPSKYTVAKTVEWNFQKQKGADVSPVEFVQGQGRTITMELFLDGLETNKDISESVEKLQAFMLVNDANKKASNKPRPPRVEFHWAGSGPKIFPSVIKSLNASYTMFHSDGRPARATVNLTLQEVSDKEKKKGQNPTSMGNAGIRSHRVVAGETLDVIAYNELGNAGLWRHIAELNRIDNPFDLKPGQHLAIAPPP
jgi:hypothetical protein